MNANETKETTMARKNETTYSVRYALSADHGTTEDHATCQQHQENGPWPLSEVIETCQATGASATLYDEAGFTRGWVRADGSWTLN